MTVRAAADVFLDSLDSANTLRSYGIGVGTTAEHLGDARPLATVADHEIGGPLEQVRGEAAVNTWNFTYAAGFVGRSRASQSVRVRRAVAEMCACGYRASNPWKPPAQTWSSAWPPAAQMRVA